MGNMRFKVGDRVRIKSIDWYNENKGNADKTNSVWCSAWFFYHMSQYCGKIMTIENVWANSYKLEGSDSRWTDEMIEGLVEEEDLIPKFGEFSDNEPLDIPTMTTEFVKEHGLPCPDGYIFKDENGNVINAQKIVLEKKKKEYQKTYEECCKALDWNHRDYDRVGYKSELLCKFQVLLLCRDAYWKIAGDEMGLGKPWEPDWEGEGWYVIVNHRGDIVTDIQWHANAILAFPTEEMRDAFYENFKELIESVKELL